jgi:hypothetical protein
LSQADPLSGESSEREKNTRPGMPDHVPKLSVLPTTICPNVSQLYTQA